MCYIVTQNSLGIRLTDQRVGEDYMPQNFKALGLVKLVLHYGPTSLCSSSNCTFHCYCLHDTTLHQSVYLTRTCCGKMFFLPSVTLWHSSNIRAICYIHILPYLEDVSELVLKIIANCSQ